MHVTQDPDSAKEAQSASQISTQMISRSGGGTGDEDTSSFKDIVILFTSYAVNKLTTSVSPNLPAEDDLPGGV